jgi:NADH:ubiquinone reductase (H+-translocating)
VWRDSRISGDTAHAEQDGKPLPGVAQVALQQGRYVAGGIRARLAGQPAPPAFRYRDKGNMATVGRAFAIVDTRRLHISGFFAWVMWLAVHIYFLIDFRNRVAVLYQWAWAYFTYQRSARLIVEDGHDAVPTPVVTSEKSAVG